MTTRDTQSWSPPAGDTTHVRSEEEVGLPPRPPVRGVGTRLAHFRIDERIASGGMGDVYRGFDTSLQRPVAIKTIRAELAKDASFLARFAREATAQANVVHPNVVQVYFIGEDQGTWFLAMQVVDGGSLADRLDGGARPSWREAATMMSDLASGLVESARLGIVHRDIKPSNVLLDRAGRPHLADFGLATAGAPSAGERTLDVATPVATPASSEAATPSQVARAASVPLAAVTQVGAVSGTPGYAAPEQLTGAPVDERADVYALGATFFHVLTGRPPRQARTIADAIAQVQQGVVVPPLRTLAPDVPRAFAAVVDRCLAAAAADRYASCAELVRALRKAGPQPIVAAGPVARAIVWTMDLAPFALLFAATAARVPWIAPALFLLAGFVGIRLLGATPGIWLMRLRLRTVDDGDVSTARGVARFLLQHGWFLPLSLFTSAVYASVPYAEALGVLALAWFAVVVVGSAGALFGAARQTLHDKLTGTRVLVDVGMR